MAATQLEEYQERLLRATEADLTRARNDRDAFKREGTLISRRAQRYRDALEEIASHGNMAAGVFARDVLAAVLAAGDEIVVTESGELGEWWEDAWRKSGDLALNPPSRYALCHPDDETLTVEYALDVLRSQHHQRIAALVEWLAGRVEDADRNANDLMAIAYQQGKEEAGT